MRRAIAIVMLVAFVAGCASMSFERRAVNVLANAATAYETAMPIVADLTKKGLLTAEEKTTIIRAALIMWSAYHEAQLALEVYHVTKSAEDEAKLETAIKALAERLSEFYKIVEPLIKRQQ